MIPMKTHEASSASASGTENPGGAQSRTPGMRRPFTSPAANVPPNIRITSAIRNCLPLRDAIRPRTAKGSSQTTMRPIRPVSTISEGQSPGSPRRAIRQPNAPSEASSMPSSVQPRWEVHRFG